MMVAIFETTAAGSIACPREICQDPAAIAPSSATYCAARAPGMWVADDDAEKADQPQHGHRADQGQKRQRAALPRGLRRPEKSVREDDKGDRVERRRKAIMQFRSVLAGLRQEQRVVRRAAT